MTIYANSDFDIRHIINANAIYQMPIGPRESASEPIMNRGPGCPLVREAGKLSGIYRWNTGLPNGPAL